KPHLTALNSGKFSEFHLPSYESSTRKIHFLARNWLFLIRNGGLLYVFNRASNPNETVYRVKDGSINLAGLNFISLNRKCLRDLLDYELDGFGPTKPAFLRSCLERIEGGEIPLTWKKDGKLMACIWSSEISKP